MPTLYNLKAKNMNNFDKEPILVESPRGWYIDYYVMDESKQKYIRKRYSKGFKKFSAVKAKRQYAKGIINELKKLIDEGYTVGSDQLPLIDAYEQFYQFKKNSVKLPANFLSLKK